MKEYEMWVIIHISLQDFILASLKGSDSLEAMAASIDRNFFQLSQTEVREADTHHQPLQAAVVYSALHHLGPEAAAGLGSRIHSTYGFRL